ncbi:MAG: dTDP-4-dehydrorhamnose reductase [Victivallaceae bacterium]|nr:dTDP-4-dehydrorhamnose reductase [Victivallaceae bacterium]
MKVIITGCKGQLGQELLRLAPPDIAITAVDIDTLDITDQVAVDNFVNELKPQLIINAAAYTAVDKAETNAEAAYAVNCDAVKIMAVAASQNSTSIIHISTDYVFDGSGCSPCQPDLPTNPASVYGQSKLAGEQELQRLMPGKSVIIRTAWLYSPYGQNFLKTMLRLMNERDELGIIADQIGTPTSAATLATTVWAFAKKPQLSGIFHWTDDGAASWYDFAAAIREESIAIGLLDSNAARLKPITTTDYPTPAPRPAYSILDKSSTYQALELTPINWRIALREVLKRIV